VRKCRFGLLQRDRFTIAITTSCYSTSSERPHRCCYPHSKLVYLHFILHVFLCVYCIIHLVYVASDNVIINENATTYYYYILTARLIFNTKIILTMSREMSHQNYPFPSGESGRHLIHGSLDPPESTLQTTFRSVQPFQHSSWL